LTFAASLTDIVVAWPISFCIGVIVGILLATRGYRIVRVRNGNGGRNGDDG